MKKRNKKSSPRKHSFGVHIKRFKRLGLHPGLFRTVENNSSPCDYFPQPTQCIRKPNIYNWQPWKVGHESEEYSKNLGYENSELLEKRDFMREHLGPGSHDIDLAVFKQATVSPCLNQNFGKQKRFRKFDTVSPGSGRYAIKPYVPNIPHLGSSLCRAPRFRDLEKPWTLSCNRYNVIDPHSMDALVRKVVSRRGPYDLFTGPREPENMFNKFASAKGKSIDKYYRWPSEIDNYLHHPSNQMKGKFNCAERFLEHPTVRNMLDDISLCYRDPNYPSPAHYVLKSSITGKQEQLYPFAISGLDVRPAEKWFISPGPGRYNIKPIKCSTLSTKNPTSVFVSKSGRTEYKSPTYNAF